LEKHVETLNEGKTFPKSEKFQFSTNERLLDHSFEYDLLVIGGGSGGFQCAKKASGMGAKVGIFNYVQQTVTGDEWGLGGTCVNVGCIPKKLFHQAGLLGDYLNDSKDFGWKFDSKEHDWTKLQNNVNSYTNKLNWKHEGGARRAKVNYIHAFASFIDENTVQAVFADGTKKSFTAKYFVIATGGRPSICDIHGGEYTINSDQIFHLKKSPGKT
jgi:thioredoxin reductase (NADPH)